MRLPILVIILLLVSPVPACKKAPAPQKGGGAPAGAATAPASEPGAAPAKAMGGLTGAVVETMDSGGYTYILLDTSGGKKWAAVGMTPVKVGQQVTVAGPTLMKGFKSKTLDRTFDEIYFGTLSRPGEVHGSPAAGGGLPAGHPPTGGAAQKMGTRKQPVMDIGDPLDKAGGPDGRTIAFKRNRRIWPAENLAGLSISTWRPDGWLPTHADEIWIADRVTHEIRHVCQGTSPQWGHHSGRLYYFSQQHNTLYSMSPAHIDARPMEVLSDCSPLAKISPDERYVADQGTRELKIFDVVSGKVVATWIAPPRPWGGLKVSWSPDSRKLSIGGGMGDIGLWVYDVETGNASNVMDGMWMSSCWSPDGSRLALTLFPPQIWLVELDSGVSTASFDSVRTMEAYCLDFMESVNRIIALDPAYMRMHYVRTDCALWMGHEEAHEYLQQFEQVLPPYNAANCASEARWMLAAAPELRNKLLPLALLLARKAAEKEPENAGFQTILTKARKWQDKLSAQRQSSQ